MHYGLRRFQAPAKRVWANRHVFRLQVPPVPLARWLSSWMPPLVRSWLLRWLPAWFLPTTVILKERNPEKADSFENEVEACRRLQALQGTHIPRFLGEVTVTRPDDEMKYQLSRRRVPAILLECVEGEVLDDLDNEALQDSRLIEQLRAFYGLLDEHGVAHGDPALHNFMRTSKGLVAIDFEFAYPLLSGSIINQEALETLRSEIERRVRIAEGRPTSPPEKRGILHISEGKPPRAVGPDFFRSQQELVLIDGTWRPMPLRGPAKVPGTVRSGAQ